MTPKERRQARVSKGLCPNCGKEAAPYYLCYDCRMLGKVGRICREFHKAGGFKREMRGNKAYWYIGDKAKADEVVARSRPDPKKGDRRLLPKLRGIRVDVEETLLGVIHYIGRPCTIEEIMEGWGRLRSKRDAPLAADLARIIAAKDKREKKAAKRASIENQGPQP